MIKNECMTVKSQKQIAAAIFELTLSGELVSAMDQPGQFVHLKANDQLDPLLRRPISICSINQDRKEFTMIYRADGKGTKQLSKIKVHEKIDVLGPLGNGFPVEEASYGETVLLVGGGIGVPPLYELSKRLGATGVNVIHILGFQNKQAVFYEAEFKELGQTYVATADGSYGIQGYVTDVIASLENTFTTIYSCGPTMMLRAIEMEYGADKKVFLSLEERMGCGIGACFACVCHTADDPDGFSYKKVCSDGPVFRAGEVVI